MGVIDGYFLPKSFETVEENLTFRIKRFNGIDIKLPMLSRSTLETIVVTLKKNRNTYLAQVDKLELAETYEKIADLWKNKDYVGRRVARCMVPSI